jgi:putative hemolysin
VELGRACILREHRQGSALFALWRGLAAYLSWSGKRYLFGCCSLTSQDPREGVALQRALERGGHVHPRLSAPALASHACADPGGAPVGPAGEAELPKLFGTYLRYGAKVVSGPALDREFRTIDWLVVLDARGLPARLWRLFFTGLLGSPAEIGE